MTDADLSAQGYTHIRHLPNGNTAAIYRFLYTTAIIAEINDYGYGERWCYHNLADATMALEAWDGEGEPEGWHRHPQTGRRRPDGNKAQEYVNP